MPIYNIQGPDGKKYRIEGPEGATAEQLGEVITSQQATKQPEAAKPTEATKEPSFAQNLVGGLKKSVLDTVQGTKQLLDDGASYVASTKIGKAVDDAGVYLGMPSASQARMDPNLINDRRKAEAPLMETGGGMVGNVLGSAAQLIGPGALAKSGSAVRNMLLTPKNVGQAAGTGAAFGGVQAVADDESRAGNALLGGLGGTVGYGAAKGLGMIANAKSQVITPEVKSLAQKAKTYGIDVSADQVANSRPLNAFTSVMKDVPFSGGNDFVLKQQKQYNQAMAQQIGETSDNLITALEKARPRMSKIYDEALQTGGLKFDQPFKDKLADIVTKADKSLSESNMKILGKQVDDLISKASNGKVEGKAAYEIKMALDDVIADNQGRGLARYASQMQDALIDSLQASLKEKNPKLAADFSTTVKQWHAMKLLEGKVSKDAQGNISFAGQQLVEAARKSGHKEIEEIARIGNQFLKDKTPNSGTATRAALMAGVYGGVSSVNPMALVTLPAALTLNKLVQSKAAANYMMNGTRFTQLGNKSNALLPSTTAGGFESFGQ